MDTNNCTRFTIYRKGISIVDRQLSGARNEPMPIETEDIFTVELVTEIVLTA